MKIIRRIKEWLPSDRTLILFPIIHCILYEVLIRVSIFRYISSSYSFPHAFL